MRSVPRGYMWKRFIVHFSSDCEETAFLNVQEPRGRGTSVTNELMKTKLTEKT
jgi:hypothetical protein